MVYNLKKRLVDQVAIVTGGTVGIGRATCIALAKEGANIVVVGRNQHRLEKTVRELEALGTGSEHMYLALDVRNETDMNEMARHTFNRFKRIDFLITAAGILRAKGGFLRTLQQMSANEWDEVVDTNLRGVFLSNKAVIPVMIGQRHGDIVNISSTSGKKGLAYDTAYCASKFGVIGLSEALAEEVRQYGIRVQVLLPGAINTGMWNQNGPLPQPDNTLPPERVADLVRFMISLPKDTVLSTPFIEPFKKICDTGWIGRKLDRTTDVEILRKNK
jgi:NAD(P)-dependent dehydrogenase (short-subunit alcohol dehydrogenase family)